eukprot:g1154.t1
MAAIKDTVTFQNQSALPYLPIPPLDSTLSQFKEIAYSLCSESENEQKELEDAIENTRVHLEKVDKELRQYAESGKASYVEEFWDDAYLVPRTPLPLNVNPFFVLEDDPTPARNNRCSRAASLTLSTLKFASAVRLGTLSPDLVRGKTKLCMSQFKKLFSTFRLPGKDFDTTHTAASKQSKHIVVLHRNQFYYFDCLDDESNLMVREQDLFAAFTNIVEDGRNLSIEESASLAIGALTSENRSVWHKLRQHIEKLDENNKLSLEIIDKAIFIVCLDEANPENISEVSSVMLHGTYDVKHTVQTGTCINRWYDKLQLIICKNGAAGVNFEHSVIDGHTCLRLASSSPM